MSAIVDLNAQLKPLLARLEQMSARERGLVFGGLLVLVYLVWQALVMDPLNARVKAAEAQAAQIRQSIRSAEQAQAATLNDPAVTAANRNRALHQRRVELDAELGQLTGGYVAPDKMSALLREVLASQQGLRLVSLKNLPVISLSQAANPDSAKPGSNPPGADSASPAPSAVDHGPFLHPVEVVVDGDYLSVVAYLHSLEKMPWRIHWQRLELLSGDYPTNRVRLVIGALSLSRDWMSL